jgi:hypothetical protein
VVFTYGVSLLEHPLAPVLVGAIFSAILVPWVARRHQNHQKQLEVNIALVSDMAQTVMAFLTSIESARVLRRTDQTKEAFTHMNDEYTKFNTSSAVLGTKLEVYLPHTDVPKRWSALAEILIGLYAAEATDGAEHEAALTRLEQRCMALTLSNAQRQEAIRQAERRAGNDRQRRWLMIEETLLQEKGVLIRAVLNARSPSLRTWPQLARRN